MTILRTLLAFPKALAVLVIGVSFSPCLLPASLLAILGYPKWFSILDAAYDWIIEPLIED